MQSEDKDIESKFEIVEKKIVQACCHAGRKRSEVTLIAASKLQPLHKMESLLALCRERQSPVVFGENYVQEALKKRAGIPRAAAAFHLIGQLQSNKVRKAVEVFDCVETVDSDRLAALLSNEALRVGRVLPVLLEVNISGDKAKAGILPEQSLELAQRIIEHYPGLRFDGLMTVTALYEDAQNARLDFRRLRQLGDTLCQSPKVSAEFSARQFQLSMGMSADFEVAIEEGATMVRIGSALFGERR